MDTSGLRPVRDKWSMRYFWLSRGWRYLILFERARIIKINSPLLTNWSRTWRAGEINAFLVSFICDVSICRAAASWAPLPFTHKYWLMCTRNACTHFVFLSGIQNLVRRESEGAGCKFVCAAGNTNARIYPRPGRKSDSAILIALKFVLVCERGQITWKLWMSSNGG